MNVKLEKDTYYSGKRLKKGETINLDGDTARRWISYGIAVEVRAKKKQESDSE